MKNFDVIIIGGSYAGLSAAMALGRSLRNVLIIDNRQPCNAQTPHSHNFLTRDGEKPEILFSLGLKQVLEYPTIQFMEDEVIQVSNGYRGFEVVTQAESFMASKLLFATGLKDILPDIPGFAESWGISVVHCPYCHGYEIRNTPTAVFAKGDMGFDFARFVQHWAHEVTLLTNGDSGLSEKQQETLNMSGIAVIDREIESLDQENGQVSAVLFKDDTSLKLNAIYARVPFVQKCDIPEQLGCVLTEQGLLMVDDFQKTNVPGLYAAGDCTSQLRSVANAVAAGNRVGAFINHELISERYLA